MIGDSTLDNASWVGIDEASVSKHLFKSKEGANDRSMAVYNLAVDCFTTSDVLAGYFKSIVNFIIAYCMCAKLNLVIGVV